MADAFRLSVRLGDIAERMGADTETQELFEAVGRELEDWVSRPHRITLSLRGAPITGVSPIVPLPEGGLIGTVAVTAADGAGEHVMVTGTVRVDSRATPDAPWMTVAAIALDNVPTGAKHAGPSVQPASVPPGGELRVAIVGTLQAASLVVSIDLL